MGAVGAVGAVEAVNLFVNEVGQLQTAITSAAAWRRINTQSRARAGVRRPAAHTAHMATGSPPDRTIADVASRCHEAFWKIILLPTDVEAARPWALIGC